MKIRTSQKTICLIVATLLIIASTATILAACDKTNRNGAARAASYVTIDVNPSIELVLDQNNVVMSASAANADANVLLWKEEGIVGMNVDVAVGKIAALAADLQYITDENKNISVTVSAKSSADEQALYNVVSNSISAAVNTVDVVVSNAVDLVLEKELTRIKAANEGKIGYGDELTLSRYRLVKKAMMCDRSLKMDDAVLKSNEELVKIVKDAEAVYTDKFGAAYALAVDEARFNYETQKTKLIDFVYADLDVFGSNIESLSDILNAIINGSYGIYSDRGLGAYTARVTGMHYAYMKQSYTYLEHYYNLLRDYVDNPIYDLGDVEAVINALGTAIDPAAFEEFKAQYADNDGNFTADSVKAFINKCYRNIPQEQRDAFAAAYDSALQELEQRVEINKFVNGNSALISAINTFIANAQVTGFNVDYRAPSAIEAAIVVLRNKMNTAYELLALTDKEKALIEQTQKDLREYVESYEIQLNERIEAARAQAEAWLDAAKEARKNLNY